MALVGGAQEEAHQAPAKWPALEWPAQPAARWLSRGTQPSSEDTSTVV